MKRDFEVRINREESGAVNTSRVDAILAPLMTCHSSAVLQFKETQKNVSSCSRKPFIFITDVE